MKSILLFFFLVFASLAGGVYLYETRVASPKAARAPSKPIKKATIAESIKPAAIIVKSAIANDKAYDNLLSTSGMVDLSIDKSLSSKAAKGRANQRRAIEKSISNTIKKSTSLAIQKAVVAELAKQR